MKSRALRRVRFVDSKRSRGSAHDLLISLPLSSGPGLPIRIPLPGEGRSLERDCFGRLQLSDVRGDVNTPAVSLQEPPEVRKVQELHAENAASPVGVEIHAGG